MIFASLYQGISQTSTAFALAALIAITFAAGLFQEFRVHRVMFASDPVSAVTYRPKVTKKEKENLFYSSLDFDKFDFDDHSIQAYQELKQEWDRGIVLVADPSAETREPIAGIAYNNDLESVTGRLQCCSAPTIFETTMLQAYIRRNLACIHFGKSLTQVAKLQSSVRIFSAKCQLLQAKRRASAAMKLQSMWRTKLKVDQNVSQSTEVQSLSINVNGLLVQSLDVFSPFAQQSSANIVSPIAAEAEEHDCSIIFITEPSMEVPAHSLPLRRSERLAARRAAARSPMQSNLFPRNTISVPMGRRSQEAPRRQSARLAAKQHICYKALL